MKHIIKIFSSMILIAVTVFSVTACRGASAYEIAVRNGFKGTESEWLESLKGSDGHNGIDGKDGADLSDYDLNDLYLLLKDKGEFTGTFDDFVSYYFSNYSDASSSVLSRCLYASCSIITGNEETSSRSAGSGVIYALNKEAGDAYIITNFHVVYDKNAATANKIATPITAYPYGSEIVNGVMECEYIGGSATYDLALLKVTGSSVIRNSNAVTVDFGDSDDLTLGETVYAIGNSEGAGISVTKGIVSVDSEEITLSSEKLGKNVDIRVIRYDAAVSPGNSGGGIFDKNGRLIGLCNSKTVASKSEGMGYAIPCNVIKSVVEKIRYYCEGKDNENIFKPLFGIKIGSDMSIGVYNSEKQRVEIVGDVSVFEINDDSPVKDVFKLDDRLISFTIGETEKPVTRPYNLVDALLSLYEGDTITVKFEREGEEFTVPIEITSAMMIKVE